ncbi:MAG TPA: single-stranded DNA-binding protein [Nocardioidaceae bacterium]|jgi:single-strand DNA-binding protein
MTRQSDTDTATVANAVLLRGRVSSAPLERGLPSGDTILTLRLVVARDPTPMTARSKQRSDWVDCVVWGGRARRSVARWRVGDIVEVQGALRRRFFRSNTGSASRVEVEVLGGRVVERAA